MPELILHPAVAADDSYSDSALYNTGSVQIGCIGTTKRTAYFRFPSATIANTATITSAVLSVQAASNLSATLSVRIFGNAADNAVAPTNKEEGDALVRTTAYVDWSVPSFASGNDYTVDITEAIQEIVSRAGWASGNALQIIIESLVSSTAYREIKDVSAVAATLTINYSETLSCYPNAAGLTIAAIIPVFSPYSLTPPVAGLLITALEPFIQGGVLQVANCPGVLLAPLGPTIAIAAKPTVAGIEIEAIDPNYVWELNVRSRPAAQTIYTCTLTGDGESPPLDDLTLPMSSFQGRIRDNADSYLSCVIPNAPAYATAIAARQNGDIVIRKGYRFQDGSTQLEEIARVDYESLRIDQGARSASATLSGHRTTVAESAKEVTVQGVSYYCLQADGKRRVRALLDTFLRIGDACIYGTGGGDWLIVGYISYTVSTELTIMEVTEA